MEKRVPLHFATLKTIPAGVWALGIVSLLMDTSSELILSIMPLFMVSVLGASVAAVGVIEGVAEAIAMVIRVFSGTISDYMGRRKPLAVIGYGLAAISKPLFPLANSIGLVAAARFIDRLGKGIRGAPRDALMSEIAPAEIRGAAFGLRQALDTVGAFLGPLLAALGLWFLGSNIRAVLWFAVIPAVISVYVLIFHVTEPKKPDVTHREQSFRLNDIWRVGAAYWYLVLIAGVLSLASFSNAFLILKARTVGIPLFTIPLVIVLMNVIYALAAYPAGRLSDSVPRVRLLTLGVLLLVVADLVLGCARSPSLFLVGICIWGLHWAFTEGLIAAMVADTTPSPLRGTAYGMLNLVSGLAVLCASAMAGFLWDWYGPAVAFYASAGWAAVAMGLLLACWAR